MTYEELTRAYRQAFVRITTLRRPTERLDWICEVNNLGLEARRAGYGDLQNDWIDLDGRAKPWLLESHALTPENPSPPIFQATPW